MGLRSHGRSPVSKPLCLRRLAPLAGGGYNYRGYNLVPKTESLSGHPHPPSQSCVKNLTKENVKAEPRGQKKDSL